MQRKAWFDGMGYLDTEIHITFEQANRLASRGESIGTVKSIRSNDETIEDQLQSINRESLQDVLFEYGAWDEEQLQDHDENLNRLLWIAGCDVAELPEDYPNVGNENN